MKKFFETNIEAFYSFFAITFVGIALLIAGHCDYVDDVITEMKNNGSYYELVEQYPNASESELVKIYNSKKN